jgi:hypothetical protein
MNLRRHSHQLLPFITAALVPILLSPAFTWAQPPHSRGHDEYAAVAAGEWQRCGKIPARPRGHFAVRKKGKVTCRGARKLMHLFLNEGQGEKHGGPSSAETYWTLYGWRCGTGAGGGGCTRDGGRDRTQAHWVP